jgi:hypothetical protein
MAGLVRARVWQDALAAHQAGRVRVAETEYQFREGFVMDSSAAQATFGLKPASWEEIVAATVLGR